MKCDQLSGLYELYALGSLEGEGRDAIQDHLSRKCESCMKEIEKAAANNALVFCAVPKVDPPNGLRKRVLAGFGLETRPLWQRVMPWSVAAAAIATLLAVTFGGGSRAHDASLEALDFLSAPGIRQVAFGQQGPHGSVLVHAQKGMLLVVVNLPAAPDGKIYEAWVIPTTGAPKPVGQLRFIKNGDVSQLIPGPFDPAQVKAIAVSLEPRGSDPVTPTQVVFAAPLGL